MLLRYLALLSLVVLSFAASAQPYPSGPIRVLIPFTAGSAADIIARAMEPAMRDRLGQSFVIDNRGGAAWSGLVSYTPIAQKIRKCSTSDNRSS